jgi:cystathionine beta-synthase
VDRSDATLSRIERGQIRPSYELVQRILSYLDEKESALMMRLTAADVMTRQVRTVDGSTSLSDAARLMEQHAISQIPVTENGRVTGSLSESGVLRTLAQSSNRRSPPRVRDTQESMYPQVDLDFPTDLLADLLTRVPAVLVTHRGNLSGIITRTDLIRRLRVNRHTRVTPT